MKYSEVDNALRAGKKIKLAAWKKAYWYLNKDGEIINHFEDGGEVPAAALFPRDLLWVVNGNWEVVEDDEPKNVNEPAGEMKKLRNFGWAIAALKKGKKVSRKNWNGKGMFLFLAHSMDITTDADLSCVKDLKGDLVSPSIVMKTADDRFCVGWLASQTDMLADDWYEVQ